MNYNRTSLLPLPPGAQPPSSSTSCSQTPIGSHPLLAQVPLTVSPFVNLPTSTTLPYTYKPMPSTLPPSSIVSSGSASAAADDHSNNNKPRYVISQSGHAAHPDDILASCRALQSYVSTLQADSERELQELDERIRARELAEKRRVAPGWLDSEARLLEPERKGGVEVVDLMSADVPGGNAGLASGSGSGTAAVAGVLSEMAGNEDEGAQMDRVFGNLALRPAGS